MIIDDIYVESDQVEKKLRIGYLFEFYGQLLTLKQREIMSMYVDDDLSPVEIGEAVGATRQTVYDAVKKSNIHLEEYEKKLGLFENLRIEGKKIDEALSTIDDLINDDYPNHIRLQKLKSLRDSLGTVSFFKKISSDV